MSWWNWQGRLLPYAVRYALLKSGFLDEETAKDLANFDVSLGSTKSVIELKNVGLSVQRIGDLCQLPPTLRLKTARISSLRLTFVRDGYQPNFELDLDGISVVVCLVEENEEKGFERDVRSRESSPVSSRSPLYRKSNRRRRSPPPYDPGGPGMEGHEGHIPTTQEMVQSFLLQEPLQERQDMVASMSANRKAMEESYLSDSSDNADIGIGVTGELPSFLSGVLSGVLDRAKYCVANVQILVEASPGSNASTSEPTALRLHIDKVEGVGLLKPVATLVGLSIDLFAELTFLDEEVGESLQSSPIASKPSTVASFANDAGSMPTEEPLEDPAASLYSSPSPTQSFKSGFATSPVVSPAQSTPDIVASIMQASVSTVDADRFADATHDNHHDLDEIRPGDDNVSWGSRRDQSVAPAQDLWRSMLSEEDATQSLLLDDETQLNSLPDTSHGTTPSSPDLPEDVAASVQSQNLESWPTLNTGQHRELWNQHQPGSWPSSNTMSTLAAQKSVPAPDDQATAKKMGAEIVRARYESPLLGSPQDRAAVVDDDDIEDSEAMTQSLLYSHEEAASMYMSALTENPGANMPGTWTADEREEDQGQTENAQIQLLSRPLPSTSDVAQDFGNDQSVTASGVATPRATSPRRANQPNSDPVARLPRPFHRIFSISSISLTTAHSKPRNDVEISMGNTSSNLQRQSNPRSESGMPGAFSVYSDLSRSRANFSSSIYQSVENVSAQKPADADAGLGHIDLDIQIGSIISHLDVNTTRILYAIGVKTVSGFSNLEEKAVRADTPARKSTVSLPEVSVTARIDHVEFFLHEILASTLDAQSITRIKEEAMIGVVLGQISFSHSRESTLKIEECRLLLGGKELVSLRHEDHSTFDARRPLERRPVAHVGVSGGRLAMDGRMIYDITLDTASLNVQVDLALIDMTFGTFGGLSGMLELGGSVLADSSLSSPAMSSKSAKGVRFAGEQQETVSKFEIKLNGRIDGAQVLLATPSTSLHLRTTAVKFVHRNVGTSVSINQMILAAPYDGSQTDAPFCVEVVNVRLEFLNTPQNKDLERLLSLLTPTNDKYENDDDILIDTLLRQRRKGSLLKVVVQNVKAKVVSWDSMSAFANLGEDLSKLSAVTKYLPEDERPGLLLLLCIKACDFQLPINENFGALSVNVQDVNVAHVGLPALLALSVGSLDARQAKGLGIIRGLVPNHQGESLPVIMARMLGDEEEPTLKVKILNLCIEYSVPLVLSFIGVDRMAASDDVLTELAQSVAEIMSSDTPRKPVARSTSNVSSTPPKKITIDLVVHDSAVGLNPQNLSSKVLLLLSDVRAMTTVPPEAALDLKVELRRAGIYLRDSPAEELVAKTQGVKSKGLEEFLHAQTYIPVASITSIEMILHAVDNPTLENSREIEIDLIIQSLLLSTCADSTATLFATLGALAPPSPPSDKPKYLTEPMTIEDMMASFTGEAVSKPEPEAETLFDIDEDISADPEQLYRVPSFDAVTQELFEESEMTSSLYGPISGIIDAEEDDPDMDPSADAFSETVASLLDEDPFEMTEVPEDVMSNAHLLRELDKQSRRSANGNVAVLPEFLYDDSSLVALGPETRVLGGKHRFSAPHSGRRSNASTSDTANSPFRLRVRDSQIIWHLYDGYDWQRTRDGIEDTVEKIELAAEERRARRRQSQPEPEEDESVIGDFLFNSIYIGVGPGNETQDLRRAINKAIDDRSETESVPYSGMSRATSLSAAGHSRRHPRQRRLKLGRSRKHKIAFELRGVTADVVTPTPGSSDLVSSVNLRIKDFEILDEVPSSTWHKFLTPANNTPRTREMCKPMFDIEILNLKTLETHSASEIALHVSALPLRLHVDQDALEFINRFFEFKDPDATNTGPPSEEPFIRRLEVETIDLCLDYKPKQVDYAGLRSGHTAEMKNFVTLDGSNIRLKHLIVYGLRGFDKIHPTLNDIWVQDVMRNQLPTVISGVATVRSLVNIGTGIRDVVAIPIREYRKDGRLVRSIRKGAYHFGKTTASELARLGAKVALGTQTVLTTAEQYLATTPQEADHHESSRRLPAGLNRQELMTKDDGHEKQIYSPYADQPLGVIAGLKAARRQLEHDLLTARDALIAVQGEVLESSGPGDAAAAVARHAPTLLLRPVIGATRAVGTTLLGVGNQIDNSNQKQNEDKYKQR